MVQHAEAIYENGILRPLTPLQLVDRAHVLIQVSDMPARDTDEFSLSEFDRLLDELASDDVFVAGTFTRAEIYSNHD